MGDSLTGVLFRADGTLSVVQVPSNTQGFLNILYGLIHCDYVEGVRLINGLHGSVEGMFYVDEEGALKEDRILNENATAFLEYVGRGDGRREYPQLYGNAVLFGIPDENGYDRSLNEGARNLVPLGIALATGKVIDYDNV